MDATRRTTVAVKVRPEAGSGLTRRAVVGALAAAPMALTRAWAQDGDPWTLIASLFRVPAAYLGRRGPHRSPLLFADGTPVRSADQWPRRRAEILAEWHGLMERGPTSSITHD